MINKARIKINGSVGRILRELEGISAECGRIIETERLDKDNPPAHTVLLIIKHNIESIIEHYEGIAGDDADDADDKTVTIPL